MVFMVFMAVLSGFLGMPQEAADSIRFVVWMGRRGFWFICLPRSLEETGFLHGKEIPEGLERGNRKPVPEGGRQGYPRARRLGCLPPSRACSCGIPDGLRR